MIPNKPDDPIEDFVDPRYGWLIVAGVVGAWAFLAGSIMAFVWLVQDFGLH